MVCRFLDLFTHVRLTDLQKLGICAPEQASPYILLNGKRPVTQLSLF